MKNILTLAAICAPCSPPVLAQVIAAYDAGTSGNPATAPDPVTQGWTLTDPSGGQVLLTDVSPDGMTGLNAWSIDDNVTFNGGRAHYESLFTQQQLDAASSGGFELSLTMRMLASNGIDCFTEFAMGQTNADDRYLLFFTISGSDIVADVFLSGSTLTCVGGNDGDYHTYTIRWDPTLPDAELLFDGAVVGPVPAGSSNPNAPNGGMNWGAGSSGATMTAHFNATSFKLTGAVGTSYCISTANSTGAASTLSGAGSGSIAANDLVLTADNLPAQPGIFIAGPSTAQIPFFNGFLCVSPTGLQRFNAVNVPAGGLVSEAVDIPSSVAGGLNAVAGQPYFFQRWNRDPAAGGGNANFSDGLEVQYVP